MRPWVRFRRAVVAIIELPELMVDSVRHGIARGREQFGDAVVYRPIFWLALLAGVLLAAVVTTWLEVFPGRTPSGFTCSRCGQARPGMSRFILHHHGPDGRCQDLPHCGPCFTMKMRHAGLAITPEVQALLDQDAAEAVAAAQAASKPPAGAAASG